MSLQELLKKVEENKAIFWGVLALAFLVYVNSLDNAFVSDDRYWFINNPLLGDWRYLFSLPARVGMWALYNIAHVFGGSWPLLYRLPNLLFHVGNTALVFLLMTIFSKGKKNLPIFTAALFAVHPILAESVAWIAGGSHAAGAFFVLLAFLLFLLSKEEPSRRFWYASIVTAFAALLFSEKMVMLAGIFWFYEVVYGSVKKNWRRLAPYLVISGLGVLKQILGIGPRVSGLATSYYSEPGYYNPLIQLPTAITKYLELIFWPQQLTIYHSELSQGGAIFALRVGIFLSLVGVWAYLFWRAKKKQHEAARFLVFWLGFFVIALSPTLTPLKVAWVVAERYVYLGSVGVLAVVGFGLSKLAERKRWQGPVYGLVTLLVILLGARTVVRNMDWENPDTLWVATAKTSPSHPNTHNNLGDVYGRRGMLLEAEKEFKLAVKLKPNYADAYHNLANTQQQIAQNSEDQEKTAEYLKKAIENYQKAIEHNPNLWQSYQNLGAIYFYSEEYEKALELFEKAIQINPQNQSLRQNLEAIRSRQNNQN